MQSGFVLDRTEQSSRETQSRRATTHGRHQEGRKPATSGQIRVTLVCVSRDLETWCDISCRSLRRRMCQTSFNCAVDARRIRAERSSRICAASSVPTQTSPRKSPALRVKHNSKESSLCSKTRKVYRLRVLDQNEADR